PRLRRLGGQHCAQRRRRPDSRLRRERRTDDHEALRQRPAGQHAQLVCASGGRGAGLRRRLAGSLPPGRVHSAHAIFTYREPFRIEHPVPVGPALGAALDPPLALADAFGGTPAAAIPLTTTVTDLMLAMSNQELPFLD